MQDQERKHIKLSGAARPCPSLKNLPSELPPDTLNRLAAGGGILVLFCYYFLNSNKSPGSGQAAIKEARRQGDPSQETRDPRDSGVKTLEDKRKREAGVEPRKGT